MNPDSLSTCNYFVRSDLWRIIYFLLLSIVICWNGLQDVRELLGCQSKFYFDCSMPITKTRSSCKRSFMFSEEFLYTLVCVDRELNITFMY